MIIKENDFLQYRDLSYFAGTKEAIYITGENKLIKCDIFTGRCTRCCEIPLGYNKEFRGSMNMLCLDGKVYLFKENPLALLIYDSSDTSVERIDFGLYEEKDNNGFMMTRNEEWIFLVSVFLNSIVLVSRTTGEYLVNTDVKNRVIEKMAELKRNMLFARYMDIVVDDKNMYLNICTDRGDVYFVLSIPDFYVTDIIDTGLQGKNFGLLLNDENIWLQNINAGVSNLLMWNTNTRKVVQTYRIDDKRLVRGDIFESRDTVIVALRNGNIYVLDKKDHKIEHLENNTYFQGFIDTTGEMIFLKDNGLSLLNTELNISRDIIPNYLELYLLAI